MSAKYAVVGRRAVGTNLSIVTIGNPGSGTLRRGRIFEIQLASRDTPVDQALNFSLLRCTALGTSTAFTPNAFDPADPAAILTAGVAHTVEPTFTANSDMINESFNFKATYIWKTIIDWAFVIPATASNGFGLRSLASSAGTPNVESTIHFEE